MARHRSTSIYGPCTRTDALLGSRVAPCACHVPGRWTRQAGRRRKAKQPPALALAPAGASGTRSIGNGQGPVPPVRFMQRALRVLGARWERQPLGGRSLTLPGRGPCWCLANSKIYVGARPDRLPVLRRSGHRRSRRSPTADRRTRRRLVVLLNVMTTRRPDDGFPQSSSSGHGTHKSQVAWSVHSPVSLTTYKNRVVDYSTFGSGKLKPSPN